jgi:hypothetical protein
MSISAGSSVQYPRSHVNEMGTGDAFAVVPAAVRRASRTQFVAIERSIMRAHIPAILLVGASLVAGCTSESAPASSESDLQSVHQSRTDVATLTVSLGSPIGGNGGPGFTESECTILDAETMDCTKALEKRFAVPALHTVIAGRHARLFCYAMNVETVSRKSAIDASSGVGFYYSGFKGPGEPGSAKAVAGAFVPKGNLVKVREVTLKNGEPGVVHAFVGLAGCDKGDGYSSSTALYELKAYMRFTASDTGTEYLNWEDSPNHSFRGTNEHMDASNALLR